MVQLRTMIGGATDSKAVSLSDGQLLDIVTTELEPILNIKGKPNYVRIFKYRQGIPQFTLGHPSRMEKMELLLDRFPGLYLTGNAYDGVGLNDCVLRSDKIVSQLGKQFSPV
jgi:oxygen-dependent protoporphyrinogen oxidase